MTTDETDEIVGEIDLLLSQPPQATNIHILQYPLRHPSLSPGTERQILQASQRPRAGRVQLELSIHLTPPEMPPEFPKTSFDEQQERGAEKAIGETQTLRSRPHRSAPDANYTVGRYDPARQAFVVVPVVSITQMRPAFDYLDAYDMKILQSRMVEKVKDERESGDVSAVQMSFRRRETERAAERRKNSHATLRMLEEKEPWQRLVYHPFSEATGRLETLFNHRVGAVKEEDAFVESTDYEALFRVHTRHIALGNVAKGALDVERFSINGLRSLPVNSAVTQIFSYARVISFREICQIIPSADEVEVLKCVRVVGMMLRGCWVMKTGLKDGERFDACRYIILDLFRRGRCVGMADVMRRLEGSVSISRNSIEAVLKEVSRYESGVGWVFRLEDDDEFIVENGQLRLAQEEDWDRRIVSAQETLKKFLRIKRK